jgi:ribosome biogenesis ATPase
MQKTSHNACVLAGGSEENIRGLFQKAYRTAPSIVFIDEIDAIASKRENREMERRIVTQLMTCMDEFHQNIGGDGSDVDSSKKKPGYVIVIGATNRPDAVDQALRRPGRFNRDIYLGVPDVNLRKQILMIRGGYGPWATWAVARVVAKKCNRDFSPNKIKP